MDPNGLPEAPPSPIWHGIVADSTCYVNLQCSPNSIKILYYPSGLYGLLLELSEALVPFQ